VLIGLVSVVLSLRAASCWACFAGFFRGGVEFGIMRLMDIMLALPSLLLAVAVVAILGPGLMNAMYAIAIVMLPHFVRLTRAAVIGEMGKDYVSASRIAGAGTLRLMFDPVLPNCAAPLIVQAPRSASRPPSSMPPRSASSASVRSRDAGSGARCSPARSNSSRARGGSSRCRASRSWSRCWPST